jgi:hypothetical protein
MRGDEALKRAFVDATTRRRIPTEIVIAMTTSAVNATTPIPYLATKDYR